MSAHRILAAAVVGLGLLVSRGARGADEPQPSPSAAPVADSGLVEEVEVTSDIARDREAPASFSTLDRATIEDRDRGQDLGMLLGDTPNAWAYSDAGNGVGYSYLSLRGFNQQRIAVSINGVPLNTPEGREVYYIDLADLAGMADRIQVQRGAGTALYGAPAVGGAVNLDTGALTGAAGGDLVLGGGSFGTFRAAFGYGGSWDGGRWAWSVRAAHVESDGYREPSWTRHSLVQLALQRSAPGSIWKVELFGGPERTQLSYYGVPLDYLNDPVLRRTNFLRPGETDTFFQPQLQVVNDRRIRPGLFLKNTFYAIAGDGYYRQYADSLDYAPIAPAAPTPAFPETTILSSWRKRALSNRQVGWIPRVTWDHRSGTLTSGLEVLLHRGRHYGNVYEGLVCQDPACAATTPVAGEMPLYDFTNFKRTFTAFARESWRPADSVVVQAELQATLHQYTMRDDRLRGYSWDATYDFLTPRLGVNWNVSPRWNVWAQLSRAATEPYFVNVWDPEDTSSNPDSLFGRYDPALKRYSDPKARPERLARVEGGAGWASGPNRVKVNLYRMDFRDEFVFAGGLDQDGVPITENAARSVHQGIEIEGSGRLPGKVDLAGYAAWSRDELLDYVVYSPLPEGGVATVDYSGNRVALFPESMVRLRVSRTFGPARIELGARRVGTIYTDNSENERKDPALRQAPGWVDKKIDPFVVADLAAVVDLKPLLHGRGRALTLRVQVENLFDRRYAAMGYSYPMDPAYTQFSSEFFPGAPRSAYATLAWGF